MVATETLNKPMTMPASPEAKAVLAYSTESVTGVNPTHIQVDQTPAPQYSESQLGFQRLLLREHKTESRSGDGMNRIALNGTILVGATLTDLAESHLVDKIVRLPGEKAIEKLKEKGPNFANEAKSVQGLKLAAEFAEEWASDGFYASAINGWVRKMTGDDHAAYVTETAAFVSDWANVILQVFYNDKLIGKTTVQNGKVVPARTVGGIKLAYNSMDFVNPVNVEAGIRILEEVPVVGAGVAWLREKTDHILESTLGRWSNVAASKGILGFHIGKNVMPL